MRTLARISALIALLVLLAGCGSQSTSASSSSAPFVRLQAARSGRAWKAPLMPLVTTDTARIQRLYATVTALPPQPPGVTSCPAEFGDSYTLDFVRQDGSTVAVTVQADGCEFVTINHGKALRIPDETTFWPLFASTFNVPTQDVMPCGCWQP